MTIALARCGPLPQAQTPAAQSAERAPAAAPVPAAAVRTVADNIHNAPGWTHAHAYRLAAKDARPMRVLNGPGWDERKSVYAPGNPLSAYELVGAASGQSCVSGPGPGPVGTEQTIRDGDCIWKYNSPVDYITITAWAFDDDAWAPGTHSLYQDYVVGDTPLRAYRAKAPCVSGDREPTGTGRDINDGGCLWDYMAEIGYWSRAHHIPKQRYVAGPNSAATLEMASHYEAILWDDRPYVAGQNGEKDPITFQAHDDYINDNVNAELGVHCRDTKVVWPNCLPEHRVPRLILKPAAGESFRDKMPGRPFAFSDGAGVAIVSRSAHLYGGSGTAIVANDTGLTLINIQIKAEHYSGVSGLLVSSFMTVSDSIIDADGPIVLSGDCNAVIVGSLIVNRSAAPGALGLDFKYAPTAVLNNSIIHTGAALPAGAGIGLETTNTLGAVNGGCDLRDQHQTGKTTPYSGSRMASP